MTSEKSETTTNPATSGSLAGLLILVAEDEPTNRIVAKAMLDRYGCDVEFAENGRDAVEKVKNGHYHLVIMDCMMPVMDGFAATQEIRAWEQDSPHRTPIVAFTALCQPEDRDRCLRAGMDDYMTKPARAQSLKDIIERWALPHRLQELQQK